MSESSGTSSMSESSCGSKPSLPPHPMSQSQHTVTTKVMATAKLKVEVHTPYGPYVDHPLRDFNFANSRPNSRNREQSNRDLRRHSRVSDH